MDPGFRGEVADFYHQCRRGYPPAAIDALADAFSLTNDDVAIDLGCGTGQLTLPLASRLRAIAGMDPEPDMLARARQAAREQDITNVSWLIGTDTDIPAVGALLGGQIATLTIAQALHWMDHDTLFRAAAPLLRPGGGIAVIANGTPLWQQDTGWSVALRRFLEQWLDTKTTATCGTDTATQQRYRDGLAAAGYQTAETSVEYDSSLTIDQIVGGVYSALYVSQIPAPGDRPRFTGQIRRALVPHEPCIEHVRVALLLGRIP